MEEKQVHKQEQRGPTELQLCNFGSWLPHSVQTATQCRRPPSAGQGGPTQTCVRQSVTHQSAACQGCSLENNCCAVLAHANRTTTGTSHNHSRVANRLHCLLKLRTACDCTRAVFIHHFDNWPGPTCACCARPTGSKAHYTQQRQATRASQQ